jgi:DNA invertase Pin-like site-specific DNA recombinase
MYKRISEEKRKTAKAMLRAGKRVFEVARTLELSRATVYRLKHEEPTRTWRRWPRR